MKARLVTGYVPIPDHPRSAEVYGELGERLGAVPVRKKAFYQRAEDTWLWRYVHSLEVTPRVSQHDNPAKNTLAYHCVQHQKTEWLLAAVEAYPDDDVYVWVDYGIFHQPGITSEAIYNFMENVRDDAIYAPGCWKSPEAVESSYPCWRFCGSVLAVPKLMVGPLHLACMQKAHQHIRATNNVEWEINTWARVEKWHKSKLPWRWYKADHDVTQFTNLPKDALDEPA